MPTAMPAATCWRIARLISRARIETIEYSKVTRSRGGIARLISRARIETWRGLRGAVVGGHRPANQPGAD